MTSTAADEHEADDLFLSFFPAQFENNPGTETDWELAATDSGEWASSKDGPAALRFVQCDCACK